MDDSSISEPIDEGQEHWTRTLDRISPRRQTARWGSWSIHFLRRNPRNDVDFRPKIEATPISFPELAVFRVERYSRVGIQYRRALPSPEESWTEHVQHQFQ